MKLKRGKNRKLNISLGDKVKAIIIIFFVACACLWTAVMFINFTSNAKEIALEDEKVYMQNVEKQSKSVEEICNLANQIIRKSTAIKDYIVKVQSDKGIESTEKIKFYNSEIAAIDNMTNLNPYLYNISLYVNANIEEKAPCFYNINRMNNMSWSTTYKDETWVVDYYDETFLDNVNKDIHLAGLISEIRDNDGKLLAVLEVSTEMQYLFMDIYKENDEEFSCFVDNFGNLYTSEKQNSVWVKNKNTVMEFLNDSSKIDASFVTTFNGEECIVSTLSMPSIGGTFLHVFRLTNTLNSYYSSQIPYILMVCICMLIFIIVIIILINNIFKRFNNMTSMVSEIEGGKNVMLPEEGNDEISKLACQINSMVLTLENYNKENINRELLLKNAEIKSLQNQINAHFMYNVLETIKMMAEINEEYQISDAVTSLGDMFRYSMKWTSGLVALRDEVQYIKNYLNLLNLRFDYEIFLSLNIPGEYMDLKIPKMSLQPIVENSVYHGIENVAEDTSIYLKVYEEKDIIYLEVSDMGIGMDEKMVEELNRKINSVDAIDEESNHGRALYNVQERIKMHFGPDYGLKVYSKLGAYTKVIIEIPKDKENNIENITVS